MSIYPTKILLATDGSQDAELAAKTIVDLSKRTDAKLHVVYAWQPLPHYVYSSFAPQGYYPTYEKGARKLLDEQVERIEEAGGVVAAAHLLTGRPAGAVLDLDEEERFADAFPDCEVGAMPPFGNLYDVPVYADRTLAEDETIVFRAGTHTDTMSVSYADFERLVEPAVGGFADPRADKLTLSMILADRARRPQNSLPQLRLHRHGWRASPQALHSADLRPRRRQPRP